MAFIFPQLSRYEILAAMDEAALRDLAAELQPVPLRAGETLFEQGDAGDAVYLVASGTLRVLVAGPGGSTVTLDELHAGASVGEMALLTAQPRVATVIAANDAELLRLGRDAFERLSAAHPSLPERLASTLAERVRRTQAVAALTAWLGESGADTAGDILRDSAWTHLRRGETLFHQGDAGDAMYLVVHGTLGISHRDPDGRERSIGEVHRGESVGEFAVLTGEARTASVHATRDTTLLRLPRHVVERHPALMAPVARVLARRAHRRVAGIARSDATVFAVVGVNDDAPRAAFTRRFVEALAAHGTTLHLDAGELDAAFGKDGAARSADAGLALTVDGWLSEREAGHGFVVYEADAADAAWVRRVTGRADRVVLVADAAARPEPGAAERALLERAGRTPIDLVLVHAASVRQPSGTLAWLESRPALRHHHVRLESDEHIARFARLVTGRATGVALGGGGARGYVHIGLLRAMEAERVPVDLIGGTSMGALVGATYALAGSWTACLEAARTFGNPRRLIDYTLPLVAMTSSRNVTLMLKHIFGDVRVEDLWIPFFCVSTSLARAAPVVHERGPVWRAVRASAAIPGVFTPVLDGEDLLVDGGLVNNLPIDFVRERVGTGAVVASNATPRTEAPAPYELEDSMSGWALLWRRLNPWRRAPRVPSIVATLVRTTSMSGAARAETVRDLADLVVEYPTGDIGNLQFDRHAALSDIGFREALAALRAWRSSVVAS